MPAAGEDRSRFRSLLIGYALAGTGSALFSTKAIFIKIAYLETPDAATLLAWRMAFALPFFVVIGCIDLARRRSRGVPQPKPRVVARTVAVGFIGYYLASFLDFEGLTLITAQLERLVLFTYPIFVMVLGAMFFGGRITPSGLLAAIITYGGLALVFYQGVQAGGTGTIVGVALVLGAALSFACYQLLAKDLVAKLGPALFTSVALSAASAACIVHYWILRDPQAAPVSPKFVMIAAAIAVIATVVPSFLINAGLARIGPQATAMISTLSPLVTIGLAVSVLGEPFTLTNAVGTALVLAGIGYYAWGDVRSLRGP